MSTTLTSTRCGHCGSSLRADAPWCTLCLTPTASEPPLQVLTEPEPPALPQAPQPAAIDPLTAPLDLLLPAATDAPAAPTATADPSWPCATCETPNPLDATACAACGTGFLDVVRLAEPPLMALPLVGDLSQLAKGQLLALACAVVAAVLAATLLVGLLLS